MGICRGEIGRGYHTLYYLLEKVEIILFLSDCDPEHSLGGLGDTLSCLMWFWMESRSRNMDTTKDDATTLFVDRNGLKVKENYMVESIGLSKTNYNGLRGIVVGSDLKEKGRVGVRLVDRKEPISLKSTNRNMHQLIN